MIEPKTKDPLDFTDAARIIQRHDEEWFQTFTHSLNFRTWKPMLKSFQDHDRKEYQQFISGLEKLRGQELPENELNEARRNLKRIGRKLIRSYACRTGFGQVVTKRSVVVRVKEDRPITSLPEEIIRKSNRLAAEHGAVRKWTFGWDNRNFVADFPDDAIERLREDPYVESIEIAPMARIMSNEIPAYAPGAVNTDWGVERCHVQNSWNQSIFGQGINLFILDTGIAAEGGMQGPFQPTHEDFWQDGVTNYKGGWNFVADTPFPTDDHDHGTYCAGIAAAMHNGNVGHYRGVAPRVNLYIGKVLDSKGSGSQGDIAAAIDWARTNGAHVISMSLGSSAALQILKDACDAAWYAGILTVAAAGNSGPDPNTVGYPAKFQSVMAVAAAEWTERIADFSSRGPEVEITAPGRYIVGPWAGYTFDDYVVAGSNDKYICASGTSAATPHVAACACLLKQWYPVLSNLDVRTWLCEHARDL